MVGSATAATIVFPRRASLAASGRSPHPLAPSPTRGEGEHDGGTPFPSPQRGRGARGEGDRYTHVYVGGSELVIPADEVCSVSGCTTVVDAGTAGANTMLGFYRLAQRDIRTRVYAFVHISGIGLAGHPHGESRDLTYLEPE